VSRSVGKLEVTVAMQKPNLDSEQLNTEGWKDINWRKAERYVFKLQKRIYAASRRGDVKQCRKLQKTLMRSWSNRVLAVGRVTVENQGKKTAGVDGIKSLPPKARFELAGQLKLTGKSKPTRRVWIPKPGREKKRHIRQYPAGKYRSNRNSHGGILGFNTLITPSAKASKAHIEEIGRIITKHRSSPQAALIKDLNPVIRGRGWTSFYTNSDAKTIGELAKQDYLTYLKLRRWAKRRCGTTKAGSDKYWTSIDGNNWVFATREGTANPLRLLAHNEFSCSSTDYVKVKGDKSPYDDDLVYWSTRLGKHPQMPNRKAKLLKQQKGKCPWCGLSFQEWDVLEVDHITPRAIGGKDEYKNLQLLHRHCHDEKTSLDLIEIRKKDRSKFLEKLSQY
jgi:5-methylcytosine-specific restriction endonuclease McrA